MPTDHAKEIKILEDQLTAEKAKVVKLEAKVENQKKHAKGLRKKLEALEAKGTNKSPSPNRRVHSKKL